MPVKISIIDYEMGNLKSINKLLKHLRVDSKITSDSKIILDSDGVILPGVGAFGDAMKNLIKKDLLPTIDQIVQEKIPLFGICLGQQLLFSNSTEMGEHRGLDIIKGNVIPFDIDKVDKVPQIGWNSVQFQKKDHYLIQGIPDDSYFYFVHSFYGVPEQQENVLGKTQYGVIDFSSMVSKENVIATQFHPEKSSKYGIQMYQNFIDFCRG